MTEQEPEFSPSMLKGERGRWRKERKGGIKRGKDRERRMGKQREERKVVSETKTGRNRQT